MEEVLSNVRGIGGFQKELLEIVADIKELVSDGGGKQKNKCLFSSVLLKMFVVYYRAVSEFLFMRVAPALSIWLQRGKSIPGFTVGTGSRKIFTMANVIWEL